MDIDRGPGIDLQKPFQTAAVVVVAVGQNRRVNPARIDPQQRGIAGKGIGLTGIEQNVPAVGFHV